MSATPDVVPVACINKKSLARFSKCTNTLAKIYSVASHEPSDVYLYSQATIAALQARIDELEKGNERLKESASIWHGRYNAVCLAKNDQAANLGAEIVALEMIAELRK